MTPANNLRQLAVTALHAARRFPVPVAVALVLYVLWNASLGATTDRPDWIYRAVLPAAAAAFPVALVGHLFAEGRKLRTSYNITLALAFALLAAQVMYFKTAFQSSNMLIAAMWLLPVLAPFVKRSTWQVAIWFFGIRLAGALLVALLAALVVGATLSAILGSFAYLFGVDLSAIAFDRIWIASGVLVAPAIALAMIPSRPAEEPRMGLVKRSLTEQGASVMIAFVAIPLVLLLGLVMHLLAVKFAVGNALPSNQVGPLAVTYLVGGMVIWMFSLPWHDTGNLLQRSFAKYWFWTLPVPIALLALSVWQRMSEYGVTPDRYYIWLIAVWGSLVFVYFMICRYRVDMRWVLAGLAALLCAGSFGPFGANSITRYSQMERFVAFLDANGVVANGRIINATSTLPDNIRAEGQSIYRVLQSVDAFEPSPWYAIPRLTDNNPDMLNTTAKAEALAKDIGLAGPMQTGQGFVFVASGPQVNTFDRRTRQVGPIVVNGQETVTDLSSTGFEVKVTYHDLEVRSAQHSASIPLAEIVKRVAAERSAAPLSLPIAPGMAITVSEAAGSAEGKPSIDRLVFWVVQDL